MIGTSKGGVKWDSKMDMIGRLVRCTKQFVQIAKKNVMFLLSQKMTVQFTAKNAIRKEKIAAAKR